MIGRILAGRYKIVNAVGEGGMSKVWRAHDMNTGKYVAVKVLREEFQDDDTFIRRFEREAQAASRMTHPNIANLLDVGQEADGIRYIVFEYVSGKTLKQFIQENGVVRPETAAQIIMRILAALQHAHQNGVIHRDIKPQNILIDRDGAVKVSDFGIARVANSQTMSQDTDTVMGSVYYFSPEQAKGADVDEKSDLYSVGIVLYEMLTGRVPFTGETPVAIAMKHIQEVPTPPSKMNEGISPALEFVVLHAMEKRPRNRYQSASEMLRDVRLALEHPETISVARAEAERREKQARATRRKDDVQLRRTRWMRRALMGAFTLILLVVTALAGYVIMERIIIARRNHIEVPSVIGKHMDDALAELRGLGLEPLIRRDQYELVPENVVADQSILPGTFVSEGEQITIMVCQSKFAVKVPNVKNISLEEAQRILVNAGLVVEDIVREPSQASNGLVIGQSIAPGEGANEGDGVVLTVSGGSVSMPRLIDSTQIEAAQTILAFGLTLVDIDEVQVEDPAMIGRVLSQEPEPFVEVVQNSSVRIEIGIPSQTFYAGSITLDTGEMPKGTTVKVAVEGVDGIESVQYTRTFDELVGEVHIALYSETARRGIYKVYYDDVLQYEGEVSFTR